MGHALSLPHPFLGWEGGVSHDNSIVHSFNDPAPLTVTYDYTFFQDTLILDTLIIDTAFVEFVNGSNCEIAADGFCDTAPDYLAYRWNCNGDQESPTNQKDPDGVSFKSDGTLIMSYADDGCSYRFSLEQIAAMRANLYDEKPNLLYNQTTESPVEGVAELLFPIDEELVQFNYVELQWQGVPNATRYLIDISRLANFPASLTNTYISYDISTVINDLLDDKKYYWRVRAFNAHHFCTETSATAYFRTINEVAVNEVDGLSSMQIFPTVINAGDGLNISISSQRIVEGEIQLVNSLGVLVSKKNHIYVLGENSLIFETREDYPAGLYFLVFRSGNSRLAEKVIIK
jgi:hypothetical protein